MLNVSFIHKEYRGEPRAIQNLIYLITTNFGLDLRVTWGFKRGELINSFKLCLVSFLNGSKKKDAKFDSNSIKMAIIFSEISQKSLSS